MAHDHGAACLCSKKHQPTPLELAKHHILPQDNNGPDHPENYVWLCPTTHVNVHEILRLMMRSEAALGWYELGRAYDIPVSRYAYQVALEGWYRIRGRQWRPVPAPGWHDDGHVHGQLILQP